MATTISPGGRGNKKSSAKTARSGSHRTGNAARARGQAKETPIGKPVAPRARSGMDIPVDGTNKG